MQKVAFVTGASSGIGRAVSLSLVKQQIHVAGMARRAERLSELQTEIENLPVPHGEFFPVTGDVTLPENVDNAVQQTLTHFGHLDILVANAGVGQRGAVVESDWKDIETVLRTNIDGVLLAIRAAVPAMRQSDGGHIITISSVAANLVAPYSATYAASKTFVSNIVQSIRMELEPDNIWLTDFLVGRTQTEFDEKRLGAGKRIRGGLPTMTAEQVADGIVKVLDKRKKTVTLRMFDRLIVLGNRLIPGIMGELAKRQYK